MFTSIVSQRTQDGLVNRHATWTGKVVCDLSRTDDLRGHYWRVSRSQRDPETGQWSMSWDQRDYMGDQRPKGPVYKFDGTTWDMKAYASTVFPWITLAVSLVLAVVFTFLTNKAYGGGGYRPDGSYHYGDPTFARFMALVYVYLAFQWTAGRWLYRVEPVRGSKVIYAAAAASEADRIYRKHNPGPSYEDMIAQHAVVPMPVQQTPTLWTPGQP